MQLATMNLDAHTYVYIARLVNMYMTVYVYITLLLPSRFEKTDYLCIFEQQYSHCYSCTIHVVNSRYIGFLLQVERPNHCDSFPCLILGGFYWHGYNIRRGTYVYGSGMKGVDDGNRYPVSENTPLAP